MIRPSNHKQVKYAVVGLGHIAQAAVLPAFAHARHSKLAALVSDDPVKRKRLGERYGVKHTYGYGEYDECLREVDAVYITLPNNLHCEYTVRAAEASVHVLCEKPMALDSEECLRMIRAAEQHAVKLMIAYRLHFEEANLTAIQIAQSGRIGEPRMFTSVFGMQVRDGNIRLRPELGGGTVYDLGIYCVNAARYLFRDEPGEVFAIAGRNPTDQRFASVDEMTAGVLRFSRDRLATWISSFGSGDVSSYRIIGTDGELRVDPAYEYAASLVHTLSVGGKTERRTFRKRDQFAPELTYFSKCILDDADPEPSGWEGLADVRVIEGVLRSAEIGQSVVLPPLLPPVRPDPSRRLRFPPVRKVKLVHAEDPAV